MHACAVLLDDVKRRSHSRPALIWCDQRTEAQCKELERAIGLERIIQLTCNPPLTNFTLTKLLWVREHEPKNWQNAFAKSCCRKTTSACALPANPPSTSLTLPER